jgi:hypothetical protein
MTQNPHLDAIFTAFGVLWVGGGGYLMFRAPNVFAKINARLGMKGLSGPRYISFIRRMGVVEMVLAALSAASYLAMAALGLRRF